MKVLFDDAIKEGYELTVHSVNGYFCFEISNENRDVYTSGFTMNKEDVKELIEYLNKKLGE